MSCIICTVDNCAFGRVCCDKLIICAEALAKTATEKNERAATRIVKTAHTGNQTVPWVSARRCFSVMWIQLQYSTTSNSIGSNDYRYVQGSILCIIIIYIGT